MGDLLSERELRRKARLRETIQNAVRAKKFAPEVVAAYAALHLTQDDGTPIAPAAHHWLWLSLLCDERIKKLLIIAPPESAKTTWTISAYLGCKLGFFPQASFIIGSSDGNTAKKRSLSLRAMVETDEWRATFPGVLPAQGLTWDSMTWSLAPHGIPTPGRLHPTIAAYGTLGNITGSRANEVIGDDLLDFENTRTVNGREMVNAWVHNSFLPRRKARIGRALMIGTAWHHDDAYVRARDAGGFVVCRTPLLSEGADVYAILTYPDNWQYERLGEPVGKAELERMEDGE